MGADLGEDFRTDLGGYLGVDLEGDLGEDFRTDFGVDFGAACGILPVVFLMGVTLVG